MEKALREAEWLGITGQGSVHFILVSDAAMIWIH